MKRKLSILTLILLLALPYAMQMFMGVQISVHKVYMSAKSFENESLVTFTFHRAALDELLVNDHEFDYAGSRFDIRAMHNTPDGRVDVIAVHDKHEESLLRSFVKFMGASRHPGKHLPSSGLIIKMLSQIFLPPVFISRTPMVSTEISSAIPFILHVREYLAVYETLRPPE